MRMPEFIPIAETTADPASELSAMNRSCQTQTARARVSRFVVVKHPPLHTSDGSRPDKKTAGIEGLTFHDLRYEATSRLFEKGLGFMEVTSITGHERLRRW